MRIGFFLLGCAVMALTLVATTAHAQQWLSDRSRTQGHGVLVGNFELHPGIGAEVGYDNNVFLAEDNEAGSGILRLSPSLYLSTLSGERLQGETPKVAFRAGVNGTLKHYFATDQATNIGIGQDAKFTWNASSIFTLDLFQDYKRAIDPFGEPEGDPLTTDNDPDTLGDNYSRGQLGGGTRLQLSTPGKLLKGGLGYRIDWDHFENSAYEVNDSLKHTIGADTSWEFLPKTAVFWNGNYFIHDYIHDDPEDPDVSLGERNNSEGVGNKLGINGALTERVGFTIAGGYDATFVENDEYPEPDGSESWTAQVQLRWRFIETSQWSLGYDRTLRPSFQGNTLISDRVGTGITAMFGGVFALGLKGELTFVDFGEDDELAEFGERDDMHILGNLSGEYRFTHWFALTGEVGYLQNISKNSTTDEDYFIDVGEDCGGAADEACRNFTKYKRFEAWLGVRAFL